MLDFGFHLDGVRNWDVHGDVKCGCRFYLCCCYEQCDHDYGTKGASDDHVGTVKYVIVV